jgi:hypothetical protein
LIETFQPQRRPSVIANTDQLLSKKEQARRHAAGHGAAWRLRMDAAIDMAMSGNEE